MLEHLKSTLASLLAAALLVSALAVPVAADTGAVKDTSFNHDIEQVQDIQVINRELHVSYAVTNQNDRAGIISALNALTVAPKKGARRGGRSAAADRADDERRPLQLLVL